MYLIDWFLLLIASKKLISFFINLTKRKDENINIQGSIHYVMVLLTWCLIVLFSHL